MKKYDFSHVAELTKESEDMTAFSVSQECLVAECGGDVRIYKSSGVYTFHCIFANHAILFKLEEKEALKMIELIKKEQSQNFGYSGACYYYDNV